MEKAGMVIAIAAAFVFFLLWQDGTFCRDQLCAARHAAEYNPPPTNYRPAGLTIGGGVGRHHGPPTERGFRDVRHYSGDQQRGIRRMRAPDELCRGRSPGRYRDPTGQHDALICR